MVTLYILNMHGVPNHMRYDVIRQCYIMVTLYIKYAWYTKSHVSVLENARGADTFGATAYSHYPITSWAFSSPN